MTEQNKLAEFTQNLDPKTAAVVRKLSEVIVSIDNRLTSDIKWRQLTFALEGDYHHWICAIAVTKKSVNVIFHFGGLLEDKDKALIAGTSKFFRKLEFQSIEDIDVEQIKAFIIQAVKKLPYFKENWRILNK